MGRITELLLTTLMIATAAVGATESIDVSVRVAKTTRYVVAFGEAHSETVRVRLFKERVDGTKVLLQSKKAAVGDDGAYRARFARPQRGTCRVIARIPDGPRASQVFPCYIPDFRLGTATLSSIDSSVEIDALIAENDEERAYGLMYRPRMRSDMGMAFLYERDTSGGFWMKNTLIPLSIAFFDSNGVILRIMHMEPCRQEDCPTYDPDVTYRGALEVDQGMFEEWGISEGDRIEVDEGP